MALVTADIPALLDSAFAYAERSSLTCPYRSRVRLEGLLAEGSDQVFMRDGLLSWLSAAGLGGMILYLARSVEDFERHAPEMMAYYEGKWKERGQKVVQVYPTSPAVVRLLESYDFEVSNRLQRMRFDVSDLLPADPRVRVTQETDGDALLEISIAAFPDQCPDPAVWREAIISPPYKWVIEDDGTPAGYITAYGQEHSLFITGLAVDPRIQGKGLGKSLINQVIRAAHEEGKDRVEVHADDTVATIGFYTRCGFRALHPAVLMTRTL